MVDRAFSRPSTFGVARALKPIECNNLAGLWALSGFVALVSGDLPRTLPLQSSLTANYIAVYVSVAVGGHSIVYRAHGEAVYRWALSSSLLVPCSYLDI